MKPKFIGCGAKETAGHGYNLICGERIWGPKSKIHYCPKCQKKIFKIIIIVLATIGFLSGLMIGRFVITHFI